MNAYFNVISLVERLHRQFLELVKLELEGLRIHDINNVQGMMLFSIGDAEMTVGELTLRGCYLGSNVSYNVKKMVENGYLVQERSLHDRRSIHVRLSEKGCELRDSLTAMHQRHLEMLSQPELTAEDLHMVRAKLPRQQGRHWHEWHARSRHRFRCAPLNTPWRSRGPDRFAGLRRRTMRRISRRHPPERRDRSARHV